MYLSIWNQPCSVFLRLLLLQFSVTILRVDSINVPSSCDPPVAARAIIHGFTGDISGTVKFYVVKGGGTSFRVKMRNLPAGAISYHIHTNPIPAGKVDCASAGEHFDPLKVGLKSKCNPQDNAKTCQRGDLSGMFGTIEGSATTEATHHITGLNLKDIINKSVVFHQSDEKKTRIACGTIRAMQVGPSGERNCP